MEHIRKLPCACCNVTLDRMCQSVHTCRCGQSLWHTGHHLRINKCNNRNIMWIHTYHLAVLLYICNNVIDRNLCSGTCCRRYSKNRHTLVFGIGNALQTAHICKFRILHNNTNTFGGIHRRTSTDRNNVISACCLTCCYTCLNILNRWVWLNIRI